MSDENVEKVREAYAAWNEGDMDAMLSFLHPEMEFVTSGVFPGVAPVFRGHEGWREFWRDFRGTWDSLRIDLEEARDTGKGVVALFRFDARGRDGLEVRREFANVWSFRDGLAVRIEAYADWGQALEAAGLSE